MDQRLSLFLRPRNGASIFTPFSKITPVVRRPDSPQEITHFEKSIEELAELLKQQDAKAKYLQEKLCDGFFRVRCKIEKLNVIEDAFADTAEIAMEKVATSLLRLFKNLFLQANYSHDSPDIYKRGNKKTTINRAFARMLNKMVRLMKNLELENFDPTPENDPTLEIGMSEIVPALPASEERDEEDEPKLTKKEWEALLAQKLNKTEEPKEIQESPSTPVVEPAMTEMDIIEQESTNFLSVGEEFKQDKTFKKEEPKIEKNEREKALEDKIDRLENLVLKILEDKSSRKKKSRLPRRVQKIQIYNF
ncbi:unnamed protein product [Oikopleura dioica]|uniref:Uncharacterized protein n=1 Tax=Oikopleura dioica TaxID=34765 RepID=E4X1H3_OIKDI|nr:unnamed protein product [Oikopleura dioica]